jgi:signal transduction histidine kinase
MEKIGITHEITDRKKLEQDTINLKLVQQKEIVIAVLDAQEEERKKIAESLHNDLGQLLYAIKIRMEALDFDKNEIDYKTRKKEIDKFLEQSIDKTRNISLLLTPQLLEQFGLNDAIEAMVNNLKSDSLWINYKFKSTKNRIDSNIEISIFRIVQELLNNLVRHSEAGIAMVSLDISESIATLVVKDDGKGFEMEGSSQSTGIGLRMVENRVKLLNGKMAISSKEGTKISVSIPLR